MKDESPLESLNLQHLLALDALLELRSVTRVAERLALTPSAVSHALRGLRETLGDPLLVRGAGGMVLTARAEALASPLRRALRDLDSALTRVSRGFDPARSQRTFTLGMGDAFTITVLPELLALIRAEAPGVDLDVRPYTVGQPGRPLERGELDMIFSVGLPEVARVRSRKLATGRLACVVRCDHPDVGEVLELETFCRLPHALMSPRGDGPGVVDQGLAERGLSRRVHLRIRYFLAAPLLIARSDLVLTGPRRLMERLAELASLRVLEPPLPLPTFEVWLLWHDRDHDDPGHAWLRDAVARAVALTG